MPSLRSMRRQNKRLLRGAATGLGLGAAAMFSSATSDQPVEQVCRFSAWMLTKSYDRVLENFHALATSPLVPADRLFLGYVLSFIAFAAVAHRLNYQTSAGRPFRGFISFLLPAHVYGHCSARIDYAVFLLNRIFTPAVLVTRLWSAAGIATAVGVVLTAVFGPSGFRGDLGIWHVLIFTVLSVLAFDFADYASHALLHRIPLLWEFHKLHHSAEVLTPFTVARVHPIEQIVGAVVSTPIAGVVTGVAAYVYLRYTSP